MAAMIFDMMETCHIYNKAVVDDSYGSTTKTYTKGAAFNAAIIKNSSTEAIVAEKQGVTEIYTVVTVQGFELDYHDVFRRQSDGAFFIVDSPAKDTEPPARSTVKIRKVTAEPWKIPDGVIVDEGDSGNS